MLILQLPEVKKVIDMADAMRVVEQAFIAFSRREASKVVADSLEAAIEEAGDIIIPINRGHYTPARIYGEIGEIADGKKPGRENDSELTLFKTVGIAVQDVAVASLVYRRAREKGLGQEVKLLNTDFHR
ncbi:MAG: ornithine cyclodeaminase [Dehalococcoidia bacterium]|nr:Delta(1)-pyrroline-2-carboxylate reductase [Chloroflexota bacterium]